MERLSDIVDQTPELKNNDEIDKYPYLQLRVRCHSKMYRSDLAKGEYQVNDVSLDVPEGTFVGIVGQSSGKAHL